MVKKMLAHAGDVRNVGWTPGVGKSPGEGKGNLLQCSCLENSVDRGAWWATVHGVAKSRTRLSDLTHTPETQTMSAAAAKSLHSHPTLCDPMDCSLPGSSVHGFSRQECWSGVPLPSPKLCLKRLKSRCQQRCVP